MSNLGMGPGAISFYNGDDQLFPETNAPIADSVLSSISKSSSSREGLPMSSILINMGGHMKAKVKLADVRKQLMTMGLFPPDLYGIGESFHEMRQRYQPTRLRLLDIYEGVRSTSPCVYFDGDELFKMNARPLSISR